jgi:hypothetical protein
MPAVTRTTIRCQVYSNPFRTTGQDVALSVGDTVQAYVAHVGLSGQRGVHVWLNECYIPEASWRHVRPKADTRLMIRAFPTGQIARTILTLAVTVVAAIFGQYYVGPILGSALGVTSQAGIAALGAAASALMTVAGTLLINALIPIRSPALQQASAGNPAVVGGGSQAASPTFALTAPHNDQRPWGPIPVIFGQHRVTPPYAAGAYSELIDNDQYIIAHFIWGVGPLDISDIRLGTTPIGHFADVEVQTRQGWSTDASIALGPEPIFEENVSLLLIEANGFQYRRTAQNTGKFSLDFVLPNGLVQLSTTGRPLGSSVNIQVEYRHVDALTWIPVLIPGTEIEIPNQGFFLNNAMFGTSPASRASRIYVDITTNTLQLIEQESVSGVGSTDYPIIPAIGRSVLKMVVTGESITSIQQELHSSLAGFQYMTPSSRQINVEPGRYFATPATFHDATSTAIRQTRAIVDVVTGEYEVRVKRVTPETTDPSMQNQVFWTVLRSIRQIPVMRPPVPLARTTVRIRASAQLSGPLDTLNGLCTSILPTWNGSAWVVEPTTNPAAIFRAILQGPASFDPLPDDELDLESLQVWAEYCTGKGLECNMVRDYRASQWDAMLDTCAAGRATMGGLNDDGQWEIVVDELTQAVQPPVQHFSERNSWEWRSEKPYVEIPHALRIRFLNEDKDYVQDEIFAYQDGYSAANATIIEQIELPGVTRASAVIAFGRLHLAQAILRPETYSFQTDFKSLLCRRGQLIRNTHSIPLWGLGSARVVAVTGSVVTLDDSFSFVYRRHYSMRWETALRTSLTRTIVNPARETRDLTLSGGGSAPAVGDLVYLGEVDQESATLTVVRVEPGSDLTARLYCVDASPGIYEADRGPIAPYEPHLTLPPSFRLIDNGGFDWDEASLWSFDDPSRFQIVLGDGINEPRSGLRMLRSQFQTLYGQYMAEVLGQPYMVAGYFTDGEAMVEPTGTWARPNGLEPRGIDPAQRVYVEGYARGGSGYAMAAIHWMTAQFFILKSVIGTFLALSATWQRFRVDDLPPAGTVYAVFGVRLDQTSGDAFMDDVLAFQYTLPIVDQSNLGLQSNYLRMRDQAGGIWHLSVAAGCLLFDDEQTQGDRLDSTNTWAWVRRQSPDLNFFYLYPDVDGTILVRDSAPPIGPGYATQLTFIDKWSFARWDIGMLNDQTYGLEAA